VNDLKLPDVYEAAARATINERCALAFLHDVRGSMQALFSALELLGRSAKAGGNPERVAKACDLARRAITRHEKSTIDTLAVLTLQPTDAAAADVGALLRDAVHFLRNDAANKAVRVTVEAPPGLAVWGDRTKLQTVLVGLLAAAIDDLPAGAELALSTERAAADVLLTIGSSAGYDETPNAAQDLFQPPEGRVQPKDLTLLFARRLLAANGGSVRVDAAYGPHGAIYLRYPLFEGELPETTKSLAATRQSDTAK
jgi:C4-dicarboxylate-specific signal transduction histidine kinase